MMAAIPETSPRALMALGLLFFLGHVPFVVANVRAATTMDDRLEALGLLIRAVPGLLAHPVGAGTPLAGRWLYLAGCGGPDPGSGARRL